MYPLPPPLLYSIAWIFFFFFTHIYIPASGQAVDTGVVPSPPQFLRTIFIAHEVQRSHCSSIFHRVLLTHALALSASHFVHKKKSPRIYTSVHSGGFELTKLTYTRLEDNLIRHQGDHCTYPSTLITTRFFSTRVPPGMYQVPNVSTSLIVPGYIPGTRPSKVLDVPRYINTRYPSKHVLDCVQFFSIFVFQDPFVPCRQLLFLGDVA